MACGVILPLITFMWLTVERSKVPLHVTELSVAARAGSIDVIVVLAMIAVVFFKRRRRMIDAGFVTVSIVGATIINLTAKLIMDDSSPERDGNLAFAIGFPSGTAMTTFALGLAVTITAWRTNWRWPIATIALISTVIVALGLVRGAANRPDDVVAGWALATVWVTILAGIRSLMLSPRQTD